MNDEQAISKFQGVSPVTPVERSQAKEDRNEETDLIMSSSPEGIERFKVTEEDLQDVFNPTRKKKFRMSKNQATYGIWAENEEEEDRPRFSSGRSAKDYTAPVNFISGGIKIGDRVTKEEEEDNITDSDEEEPESRAPPPKSSLGSRNSRTGFQSMKLSKKDDIANWERHTKGIGQKLLEKMGHVPGKGLGKNLQGISTPVEATLRKGRGAIGLYGPEKTERAEKDFPTKPDSDEEEAKEFNQKLRHWQKGKSDKTKTIKLVTAEELIASGAGKSRNKSREVQSDLAKVKVIDMTGKEQRVLSGYHSLSLRHDKPDDDDSSAAQEKKHFDLPELLHNLDLLVGMAEELNYEQDMIVNLEHEHSQLKVVCEQEERHISRLNEVMKIIDRCTALCDVSKSADKSSLELCAQLFRQLQDDYYEEYTLYDLSSVAVSVVYPLVNKEFEGWEPLKQPEHGTAIMQHWKRILEGTAQPYHQGQTMIGVMQPYDRLIWEILMPYIRNAVRSWNVRYPDPMLVLIETWLPLLEEWMTGNILEQFIYPKLQAEVENWNPLTDTITIHSWVHPWLPLMGERLSPLYPTIRQKLANALTKWHPSDPSAKAILQPWVGVFNQSHMDVFVVKHIVPKLALCLQEFNINPNQQQLDPWNWVMSWADIIPRMHMVNIVIENFFPKWLRVLSVWLSANANYDEVVRWYTGWKTLIPDQLISEPAIKEQLNEALEIMNRAVLGQTQPGARENVAYLMSTERRRDFEPPDRRDASENGGRNIHGVPCVAANVRDRIEQKAQERGILFMPAQNKTHDGKQVHKLGSLLLYTDRGLIYFYENGRWIPTSSLDTLFDKIR